MTIQTNAIKQYFPVVLFIMLYTVGLIFESVDKEGWWSGGLLCKVVITLVTV